VYLSFLPFQVSSSENALDSLLMISGHNSSNLHPLDYQVCAFVGNAATQAKNSSGV